MNPEFTLLVTCGVVLCAGTADAQMIKQFDRTFGGSADEGASIVLATADGGYFLAAESLSDADGDKTEPSQGGADFWVVKTDGAGNKVWDRTFGGTQLSSQPVGYGWVGEWLAGAALTLDGGYVLVGTSFSEAGGDKSEAGRGGGDYWVVRLDANGDKVWDKTIGGPGFDWADGIVAASDGGFLVVGSGGVGTGDEKTVDSFGGWSGHDYWVVKLDGAGNKLWDRGFGGGNWDSPHAGAVMLTDGSFVIGGTSTSPAGGNKTAPSYVNYQAGDFWAVKIDENGNTLWDKAYGGTGEDQAQAIVPTQDGGFALLGVSASDISGDKSEASRGSYDFWLVKADANGNKQWDRTFGTLASDSGATALVQTADDGFLLAGTTTGGIGGDKTEQSHGAADVWIIKTDSAGNKRWDKTLGGSGSDYPGEMAQSADGGYVIGTVSTSDIGQDKTEASRGGSDAWLVKLVDASTLQPTATGIAYVDVDANCVYDPAIDYSLANRLIQADPGPYFASTDGEGNYFLRLPDGDYTLQQASIPGDPITPSCPGPLSSLAVQVAGGALATPGDFANESPLTIQASSVNSAFGVYPYPNTSPCPGIANTECVAFANGFPATPSTTLNVIIGGTALPTIVAGSATAVGTSCPCAVPSIFGNMVSCGAANWPASATCTICVDVIPTAPLLPPSAIDMTWQIIDGNGFFTMGIASDPVLCSQDPNDLVLLSPASCGPAAYVPNGQPLVYRVRFQNKGTAPAHNVVISDVLDPTLLDASSLEVLGSSHPLTRTEVFPGGQLVLSFVGIELPAESADALGSIGTVIYSVRPKPGLLAPLTIVNQASIIFDLNEAILTNQTSSTVIDNLPPVSIALPTQSVCLEDPPFALSGGDPAGGTYSGDGVAFGVFDPAAAGVGPHAVDYAYTEAIEETAYTPNQVGTFAPLSGSGQALSLGDDQVSGAVSIGFPFTFYGVDYSSLYVSSNGFITFNAGSSSGCCAGGQLPTGQADPSNLIAFAWDDLNPSAGGTIDTFTVGSAPDRKFVVRFDSIQRFGDPTLPIDAQVILHETTNVIEIHSTATTSNNSMTMGIENDGGTLATSIPGRNAANFSVADDFVQLIPPASERLCAASATQTIVVRPLPEPAIYADGPTTICAGQALTLTAIGGESYLWSTGETGPSITVTSAGWVGVQVTDPYGCAAMTEITIAAAADGDLCGDSADMCQGPLTCSAGVCGAFSPLDCDDANPCTSDSCDSMAGCDHAGPAVCGEGLLDLLYALTLPGNSLSGLLAKATPILTMCPPGPPSPPGPFTSFCKEVKKNPHISNLEEAAIISYVEALCGAACPP